MSHVSHASGTGPLSKPGQFRALGHFLFSVNILQRFNLNEVEVVHFQVLCLDLSKIGNPQLEGGGHA